MHTCPNGKRYIGITSKTVKERWGSNGVGYHNQTFYKAIKKYGWNNILHEIVDTVETIEEAAELETGLIAKYKTTDHDYGYNISPSTDAVGGLPQPRHSAETRRKMSQSAKARPMNTRNLSGWLKSRRKPYKGEIHNMTPSGANSIRDSNGKVVVQYTADNEPIAVYECAATAWAETKINPYPSLTITGRKCGGYFWKYDKQLSEEERTRIVFSNPKLYFHNEKGELTYV